MSDQEQYFNLTPPVFGRIACIAVTSTSAATDLSADATAGKEFINGQMIRLYADGADVYFAFSTENASTIDDTATGASAGKCGCIPAGTSQDFCCAWLNGAQCKYLYTKTKTGLTATLRITTSSSSFQNKI